MLGEGSTYASYNRQINVLGLTSFMLGMHITEEPWEELLRGNGIVVSQARIAASLRCVAPIQYGARSIGLLNPSSYCSFYYGENFTLTKIRRLEHMGLYML